LASQDGPALAEALMAIGVPAAPVLSVSAALKHPHTAHRQMVVQVGDAYTGVASPIKLSRTPASYRLAPPVHSADPPAP
jgi:crotonobetainyl-CoA:carnitine CoA-transferase CaiB-like acyl-CoA transferase